MTRPQYQALIDSARRTYRDSPRRRRDWVEYIGAVEHLRDLLA